MKLTCSYLIGLYYLFLWIGVTLAIFHSLGTLHWCIDNLISLVSEGTIACPASLRSLDLLHQIQLLYFDQYCELDPQLQFPRHLYGLYIYRLHMSSAPVKSMLLWERKKVLNKAVFPHNTSCFDTGCSIGGYKSEDPPLSKYILYNSPPWFTVSIIT